MNATRNIAIIGLAAVTLLACNSIKKVGKKLDEEATYSTDPKFLEVHGDSVAYETKVTVPAKAFHKRAVLKVDPVLMSGDKSMTRPPLTIGGGKQRSSTQYTIDPKNGGTVTVQDKFAYDPAYAKSTLVAKNSLTFEGKFQELDQCMPLKDKKLADGVIATSQMLKVKDGDIYMSKDEYKPTTKKISANIYYLVNSSNFNPRFSVTSAGVSNDVELKYLAGLISNDTFQIKGITVNSYASPDGPMANNERLAKARAEATNKYLKGTLKKEGVKEVNDSAFYASYSVTENWQGWREEVAKSDLPDKDAILNIMNSSIDDEEKEMRIKREHAASYDKMRTTILPRLRKSEVLFGSASSLKTEAELLEAGKQSLDNLSQDEEMQYGKVVKDNDEKRRTYTHYTGRYANDWRGYNNLAVVQLESGELDEAKRSLDRANELSPNNAYVLNNYGVYYAMKKEYDNAMQQYNSAKSVGNSDVNPNYNIGVLQAKRGMYKEALESFASVDKCRYNVALTYLLNKDYTSAESSLKCVPDDKKDADYYYISAVLGARKGNLDEIISNLRRAFDMNPSLKAYAKNDGEFYEFRNKAEFEALVK